MIENIIYWGTVAFIIINFITILIMTHKPGTGRAFREKDIGFFIEIGNDRTKLEEVKLYEKYSFFRTIHFINLLFNIFISICAVMNIIDGELLNIISSKKYGDFLLFIYFIESFVLVTYKAHEKTNDINKGNILYINEKKDSCAGKLKIKVNSFILKYLSKIKKNTFIYKFINILVKLFLLLPLLLLFYKLFKNSKVVSITLLLLIIFSAIKHRNEY